jgi:hypothetical protein
MTGVAGLARNARETADARDSNRTKKFARSYKIERGGFVFAFVRFLAVTGQKCFT